MGNYYGKFYGYTGLFPILENAESESHVSAIRSALNSLPNDANSIFSRTGLVHGARLFIIDDVVYNGHPTPEEHLEYSYIALSLTFDGELEGLCTAIAEFGGEEWDSIFSHCYGFASERKTPESVLEYMQKGQVTTSFLYVDADGNLKDTLKALVLQKEVAELVEKAQFLDTAAKKLLVSELANKMSNLQDLVPGDFTIVKDSIQNEGKGNE